MDIEKGTSVAVSVYTDWANYRGVRLFLRHYNNPEKEIDRSDGSHIITARLVESNDPHGIWIELYADKHAQDPGVKTVPFMIPWQQVLSIAVVEDVAAMQNPSPQNRL